VVDKAILAAKVAAIRDAVDRIRTVLPPTAAEFVADRTVREVVTLNLFLALQDAIALATHWLADAGVDVPATYGETFSRLAARGVLDPALAGRLRAAVGLRNLIAHQYGAIDYGRLFRVAADDSADLLQFCEQIVRAAEEGGPLNA
jgi:uncharacterized protein YutE (UPF0331/DUF86 family)